MAVSLTGSSARTGLDILASPGKFHGIGSRILAAGRQPYDLENEPNGATGHFSVAGAGHADIGHGAPPVIQC